MPTPKKRTQRQQRQRHPTVGVYDTLKRYYISKMSKVGNNRRKKSATMTSREAALDRFVELTTSGATTASSVFAPRHTLTLKQQQPTTTATDDDDDSAKNPTGGVEEEQPTTTAIDASTTPNDTPAPAATTSETSMKDSQEQKDDDKAEEKEGGKNGEGAAEKRTTATTAITTTTRIVNLKEYDHHYYKSKEEDLQTTMADLQAAQQSLKQDQVALWGVYRYGLQHVLGLNDLASAPDAILPGNF